MSERSIAVIICAYTEERWSDLLKALSSVRRQTLPATECILVIDHNPGLFARARAEWPDWTVIENTGPRGVSGARNTGIAIARSDLIAFLDDDAVAEPDWLAYLTQPFADEHVLGT